MRHVGILAQPIGRFHDVAALAVTHYASGLPEFGFLVLHFFRIQFIPVLVVRLPLVVHEKVDTSGKKVDRRGLKELVAASSSLFLAFL